MSDENIMAELDEMLGADSDKLGELANALVRATQAESEAKKEKDLIKARIISILDERGDDGAIAGGRRLGFTTRKYYGVAQGDSPEQRAENLQQIKQWLEQVAPEVNVPASANIGKAVNAYLDANPSAEVPDFVAVTEKRSLTNRQA